MKQEKSLVLNTSNFEAVFPAMRLGGQYKLTSIVESVLLTSTSSAVGRWRSSLNTEYRLPSYQE